MDRGDRRLVEGFVIGTKMNKTISVRIERFVKHPIYGKYLHRSTILKAHDEKEECDVGDRVRLMECRPISKTKNWRLVEIINQAPAATKKSEATS